MGIVVLMVCILFCGLFYVQIIKNQYYINNLESLTANVIESTSTPRGRIYDRNHRLIVDNIPVKVIYYKKQSGMSILNVIKQERIRNAKRLLREGYGVTEVSQMVGFRESTSFIRAFKNSEGITPGQLKKIEK